MEKRTNIDILYQIAIDRLDAQIKRINGIDTKIGMTFGLTNGITAALVVFIVFLPRPISQSVLTLTILTGVAYAVTLSFLFFAYRWGRWSFNPDVTRLKAICTDPKYHDYPHLIKEWVAVECMRSLESNRQPLTNKVRLANKALITLSAQGLLLAVSLITYLFT